MDSGLEETADPRVRRTRQLLHEALARLLENKEFERITVHDITDAATLNRATFYDHYPDKYALLESMVAARFQLLMAERNVQFDGCSSAMRAMVLVVCDYLAGSRELGPPMESAVISVIRQMILGGLTKHEAQWIASPEMIASTVSWAIYGAAKEWARTLGRCAAEEIVDIVVALVAPVFSAGERHSFEAKQNGRGS
jgi:AcrR family transcriptional regulator